MDHCASQEALAYVRYRTDHPSPWWRRAALITMLLGFAVLILLTVRVYTDAPSIAK